MDQRCFPFSFYPFPIQHEIKKNTMDLVDTIGVNPCGTLDITK